LKKYLDCLGENEEMDATLIRVRIRESMKVWIHMVSVELYVSNDWCITLLSLSSNYSSWFKVNINNKFELIVNNDFVWLDHKIFLLMLKVLLNLLILV
jgi:hypothetical protein